MALVMALKPLHDIFNLLSIVPVSYQAVSGSGKSAIESLENELANLSTPGSAPDEKYYQSQIAKNVIPIAGNITENGYSDEEMKFSNESKKILDIPDLNVEPSNARVGVETGHGIFCTATFEKDVDVESAIESLEAFEGVEYWKETYPTPLDAQGNKNILVSRMRSGLTSNKILNFWAVGDNLLKGAALNAVQIANHLYKNDFYTK
jgi:aspartate-semialdehyde dehydrogenase